MKASVAELLHLVGGGQPAETAADVPPPNESSRPVTMPKRSVSPRRNGHSAAPPVTAGTANGRGEIPMEGDFRDF
jgi:hypothetical protein